MGLRDTHVWLWFANDDRRHLGRRSLQLVKSAQDRDAVRISPVSLFEIASLYTSGRIRLAVPVERWLAEALTVPGIRIGELTSSAATHGGLIPRTVLPDPIDRLLVATARELDATMLTVDDRILRYAAATDALRVHDASR